MPVIADLKERLARLPKVDEVLADLVASESLGDLARPAVVQAIRAEVERQRRAILDGEEVVLKEGRVVLDRARILAAARLVVRPSLRRVINATGVVLHTNLGRAPLARQAIEHVLEVARGYCTLEYALGEGERGSRQDHVAPLLRELVGAESALVVNNGAAAVLLALGALAAGREALVSRGELVEIGGSFRVPDVMTASGAVLVEVGTTNRTHLGDYERAIGEKSAVVLKVHRSNFALVGFTAEVPVRELAELAHRRGLPLVVDLGSGALVDLGRLGLDDEWTVQAALGEGADLVTFSGDKLLGGPQAGLIVGRAALVDRLKAHPLMRALRPDKLSIAALETTLALYRDERAREVPALAMSSTPEDELRARADRLRARVPDEVAAALGVELRRVRSAVGGGALPRCEPWSWALALGSKGAPAERLEALARGLCEPPVIGRIAEDRLIFDLRTVGEDELDELARALGKMATELKRVTMGG